MTNSEWELIVREALTVSNMTFELSEEPQCDFASSWCRAMFTPIGGGVVGEVKVCRDIHQSDTALKAKIVRQLSI